MVAGSGKCDMRNGKGSNKDMGLQRWKTNCGKGCKMGYGIVEWTFGHCVSETKPPFLYKNDSTKSDSKDKSSAPDMDPAN